MRFQSGTDHWSRCLVPGVVVGPGLVGVMWSLGLVRLSVVPNPANSLNGVRKFGRTGLEVMCGGGSGVKLCKCKFGSAGPGVRQGSRTAETETAVAGPVRLGVSDELPCCP